MAKKKVYKLSPTSSQVHVPVAGEEQKFNENDLQKDDNVREVAKVLVVCDGKVLMGTRSDNGKWDFPGGRAKNGEDIETAAIRETVEETGVLLSAENLEKLAAEENKKGVRVHVFRADLDSVPEETDLHDRDDEFDELAWVDCADGMPDEIVDDLHTPAEHNAVMNAITNTEKADFDGDPELRPGINNLDGGVTKDEPNPSVNESADLRSAQELISGMDWESKDTSDPIYAQELALMNLIQDPLYYRKKRLMAEATSDELEKDTQENEDDPFDTEGYNDAAMDGLWVDLGSGQCREPGFLGLDLYPYDYGTAIHDMNTGLPLPSESVGKARLVNVVGHEGLPDPKALLSEIHRVMMPGGEFTYEGPEEIYNHPEWTQDYPGLVLTGHEDADVEKDGETSKVVRQSFTRIAMPDPATANDAEPRIGIAQYDMLPADALLAVGALDYFWSDATSSGRGNRLMGYPSQGGLLNKIGKSLPIAKIDRARQIVYCVVLAPNELDSQDDYMEPEDIEKTAHGYLAHSRTIGSEHEREIDAIPVESYIAPVDFEFEGGQNGPQSVKKGSWILGIYVRDPEEWQKVVSGEYEGVSVGGQGLRDEK